MSESPAFAAHVLDWLRTEGAHPSAASVENVTALHYDYFVDTDHGSENRFGVEITWLDGAGKKRTHLAEGDDLESLWRWVVSGWPAAESVPEPGEPR